MATVGLHELVGSIASAIVEAQGLVELHYLKLLSGYFDDRGHPISFDITLPSGGPGNAERHLALPLLSLVESSPLAITEMNVDLEVELGDLSDTAIGAGSLGTSGALAGLKLPSALLGHLGAPIDIVAPSPSGPPPPEPPHVDDRPATDPAASGYAARSLNVGLGGRTDTGGPLARLSIKVAARQPSEGLLRLITQLNKTV